MPYIGNRPADPTEADNFVVDNFTAGVGFTAGSSTCENVTIKYFLSYAEIENG